MWQISGADASRCFLQIHHHPIFVTLKKGTGQGWASISVNTALPRWLCNTNRWTLFAAIHTNLNNTECSRMILTIIKITWMKYYNICHHMSTLSSSNFVKKKWTFWSIVSNKGLFRWTNDRQLLSVKYFSLWFWNNNNNRFVYPGFTFSYSRNIVGESLWSSGVGISKELFTTKAGFRHTLYKLNSNFDLEKGQK